MGKIGLLLQHLLLSHLPLVNKFQTHHLIDIKPALVRIVNIRCKIPKNQNASNNEDKGKYSQILDIGLFGLVGSRLG